MLATYSLTPSLVKEGEVKNREGAKPPLLNFPLSKAWRGD
jgi:hypothetical protein